MKKIKTKIFFTILFYLSIFCNAYSAINIESIVTLINAGQGISAKESIIKEYENEKNENKKNSLLVLMLETCMFINDNECFYKYWDKDSENLYEALNKLKHNNAEETEQWMAIYDSLTSKDGLKNSV